MSPNNLSQTQLNILSVSALRCLIRQGVLQKEDIIAEMSQQGVPAEWAYPIVEFIQSLPGRDR